MDIRSSLKTSAMIHAADAYAAIEQGWEVSTPSPEVSLVELQDIYSIRLKHLRTFPGEHASGLAASVEELLASLRMAPECSAHWVFIRSNAEHHFLVLVTEKDQVLGCMRVVSQLDVSSQRWQELWQRTA